MAGQVKTYNADEMQIVFGPVLIESGFGADSYIRVEQESDDVADEVGADGEVTISRTNDGRATITFILMQTAIANDGLTIISNATRSSPGMVGAIHPVAVKDPNGRALYTAQNAWIMKPPDAEFARGPSEREWTIRVAQIVRNDGGS